jgi:serine phosphatase RsbU (regulator of sigma subunit)
MMNPNPDFPDEKDIQLYYGYITIVNVVLAHMEMAGIKAVEVLVPDADTYYTKCTEIFGEDENNLYELGDEKKVESKKLKKMLEKIWTGEATEESMMEFSEETEITICKALVYGGELSGILLVRRSIQNIVSSWNRYLIGISILGGSLLLIGTLLIGLYLRVRIVKPVNRVTQEADRFARENVIAERKLSGTVGKITEIRVLAGSIDKMEEGTMKNMEEIAKMSRESERIDTELTLAANLQMSVLPKGEKFSGRSEFDVSAKMNPAREVGGDFYDFFFIDDTHLVLVIADVSDKGVGAAFFMAVSKTLLKARASMGGSPAEIVTFAEEKLSEENEAGMFITAWLGIVDIVTGEVRACNAGHNFPAILRADTQEGYRIDKTEHGPPICFLPGVPHVEYQFRLHPGDRLFLYTDGVTEAKNPEGERFGTERLVEALNNDREIGNASLILRVKAAVDHFAGAEAQYDDMTMVSFTYLRDGKR